MRNERMQINSKTERILLWVVIVLVIVMVILLVGMPLWRKYMKQTPIENSEGNPPTSESENQTLEDDGAKENPPEEEVELNEWGVPVDELQTSEMQPIEEFQLNTKEILLTDFKAYEEDNQTIVEEKLTNTTGHNLIDTTVIIKIFDEKEELVVEYPIFIQALPAGETTTMGGPIAIPLAKIQNIQAEVATSDKIQ